MSQDTSAMFAEEWGAEDKEAGKPEGEPETPAPVAAPMPMSEAQIEAAIRLAAVPAIKAAMAEIGGANSPPVGDLGKLAIAVESMEKTSRDLFAELSRTKPSSGARTPVDRAISWSGPAIMVLIALLFGFGLAKKMDEDPSSGWASRIYRDNRTQLESCIFAVKRDSKAYTCNVTVSP